VCGSQKSRKKLLKIRYFYGSMSSTLVYTRGKLVGSACYDTQQVFVYLQPLC